MSTHSPRPGKELPKWQRIVVNALVDQNWRYVPATKGATRARAIPPNRDSRIIVISTTSTCPHGRKNLLSQIRAAGASVEGIPHA